MSFRFFLLLLLSINGLKSILVDSTSHVQSSNHGNLALVAVSPFSFVL